jgi:hypothetical protein
LKSGIRCRPRLAVKANSLTAEFLMKIANIQGLSGDADLGCGFDGPCWSRGG